MHLSDFSPWLFAVWTKPFVEFIGPSVTHMQDLVNNIKLGDPGLWVWTFPITPESQVSQFALGTDRKRRMPPVLIAIHHVGFDPLLSDHIIL